MGESFVVLLFLQKEEILVMIFILKFICRSFQVGREKFYIPWLLVVNRKSTEVPMIDVELVMMF